MVMTLRVTIERGMYLTEDFMFEIEMQSDNTLLDLHYAIQETVDFDNDHPFEFLFGRHLKNRKFVFEPEEGFREWNDYYDFYESIPLAEVWPPPEKNVQLFYHFDFGDDWYFKIRKMSKKDTKPEPEVKYPRVTKREGNKPKQYPNMEE